MQWKIRVSSIYQEEQYFHSCQMWCYPVTGKYLIQILVPVSGIFFIKFFNIGFRYLWQTFNLVLLCGWYGAENILVIPSCCKTWSMRLFFNSVLLSDKMYHGHMYTGKYSFINVETIVSMVLSSRGNASGHTVRWTMIVSMCLLPHVDILHSVTRSIPILSNGLSGISVICKG